MCHTLVRTDGGNSFHQDDQVYQWKTKNQAFWWNILNKQQTTSEWIQTFPNAFPKRVQLIKDTWKARKSKYVNTKNNPENGGCRALVISQDGSMDKTYLEVTIRKGNWRSNTKC